MGWIITFELRNSFEGLCPYLLLPSLIVTVYANYKYDIIHLKNIYEFWDLYLYYVYNMARWHGIKNVYILYIHTHTHTRLNISGNIYDTPQSDVWRTVTFSSAVSLKQ